MLFLGVKAYNPGRVVYLLTNEKEQELAPGDWCLFQAQDDWEIGTIQFCVHQAHKGQSKPIRKASPGELEEYHNRERIAHEAMDLARKRVQEYQLPMKLTGTKYPLTGKKIVFYYTAKERVDFRRLVRDLAKVFKVRVQMQQIGVRDEPQILGGVGICGREVCCACFLCKNKNKLESVALEAARIQNLPLVSSKISGICGRLRCCINFEYPTYSRLAKQIPSVGQRISVNGEQLKVVGNNLLTRTLIVENADGARKAISSPPKPEK